MITPTTRNFRVFVGSTFPSTWLTCACLPCRPGKGGIGAGRAGSDLETEHNALQNEVFPRMGSPAESKRYRFQAINLLGALVVYSLMGPQEEIFAGTP